MSTLFSLSKNISASGATLLQVQIIYVSAPLGETSGRLILLSPRMPCQTASRFAASFRSRPATTRRHHIIFGPAVHRFFVEGRDEIGQVRTAALASVPEPRGVRRPAERQAHPRRLVSHVSARITSFLRASRPPPIRGRYSVDNDEFLRKRAKADYVCPRVLRGPHCPPSPPRESIRAEAHVCFWCF